jgi:hypothetical protein
MWGNELQAEGFCGSWGVDNQSTTFEEVRDAVVTESKG